MNNEQIHYIILPTVTRSAVTIVTLTRVKFVPDRYSPAAPDARGARSVRPKPQTSRHRHTAILITGHSLSTLPAVVFFRCENEG